MRIRPVTTAQVLAFVRARIATREPALIATVNAEFVVLAQQDEEFRGILNHAELATPDSAGVLWALRRRQVGVPYRVGGSDLVWSLSLQAEEFGHRIFLLGAGPGVAEAAADRLVQAFPRLQIAGMYSGSPDPSEEVSIVHLIRRSRADLLFVAFGAPRQEKWIARNLSASEAVCALGVGGSLDYVAGTAVRAPIWMREHHLDWLWRLIRQPRRAKRMLALPRFVWMVWRQDRGSKGERT